MKWLFLIFLVSGCAQEPYQYHDEDFGKPVQMDQQDQEDISPWLKEEDPCDAYCADGIADDYPQCHCYPKKKSKKHVPDQE